MYSYLYLVIRNVEIVYDLGFDNWYKVFLNGVCGWSFIVGYLEVWWFSWVFCVIVVCWCFVSWRGICRVKKNDGCCIFLDYNWRVYLLMSKLNNEII